MPLDQLVDREVCARLAAAVCDEWERAVDVVPDREQRAALEVLIAAALWSAISGALTGFVAAMRADQARSGSGGGA